MAAVCFKNEKARNFLLEHNFALRFRRTRRAKPKVREWATDEKRQKIADILVLEMGKLPIENIRPFVQWSGFDSWNEWYDNIAHRNKTVTPPNAGWLYLVVVVGKRGDQYDRLVKQLKEVLRET